MSDEIKEVASEAPGAAGIGMSEQDQKQPGDQPTPMSSLCRERMVEVIKNTKQTQAAAEAVLKIVNDNPELDAQFCMLFGIRPHGMPIPGR